MFSSSDRALRTDRCEQIGGRTARAFQNAPSVYRAAAQHIALLQCCCSPFSSVGWRRCVGSERRAARQLVGDRNSGWSNQRTSYWLRRRERDGRRRVPGIAYSAA